MLGNDTGKTIENEAEAVRLSSCSEVESSEMSEDGESWCSGVDSVGEQVTRLS